MLFPSVSFTLYFHRDDICVYIYSTVSRTYFIFSCVHTHLVLLFIFSYVSNDIPIYTAYSVAHTASDYYCVAIEQHERLHHLYANYVFREFPSIRRRCIILYKCTCPFTHTYLLVSSKKPNLSFFFLYTFIVLHIVNYSHTR